MEFCSRGLLKALLHYVLFHLHFGFISCFSCTFPRVYDTNMLVSKTRVKTREKRGGKKGGKTREKCETNARKTREKSKTRAQCEKMFLYYTMRWVKVRVSCILFMFLSRFCSQTFPKRKPNALCNMGFNLLLKGYHWF